MNAKRNPDFSDRLAIRGRQHSALFDKCLEVKKTHFQGQINRHGDVVEDDIFKVRLSFVNLLKLEFHSH